MQTKQIIRKIIPNKPLRLAEEIYRKSRVDLVNYRLGKPATELKIIAITGTNGKTSTCNFLNDLLKSAGLTTAMYTTANIEMAGNNILNTKHRTVPLISELFAFLKTARANKVDWVILETTSHALDQHKLWKIPVEIAAITNLTQDHLDYHGTMEKYAASKARLFNEYCRPKRIVLNSDDNWFEYFKKASVAEVSTYGKAKSNDFATRDIRLPAGIIGEFNRYNIACAATISRLIGLSDRQIEQGIATIKPVVGRMQTIQSPSGYTVVIDYAHTPDALEKALEALKTGLEGRLTIVFGATGDRDKSKRPIMGQVAAKYADHIYLTDDETYTEDGDAIRASVMQGIVDCGAVAKTTEIADRKSAITAAISQATKGDVILLAGIGHQDYRAMGGNNIVWDEFKIATDLVAQLS
jgi:UDP-N-acetylmuramoyl-L-alanyl-D-glutamate--2,6-diaminopimelate ligase